MHLQKPTTFVKDGVKRVAYFTVEAKEFKALGFVEQSEAAKKEPAKAQPKAQKKTEAKTRKTSSAAEKIATKAASYFQSSEVKADD